MTEPRRLEEIRGIARRPYSFVAFCSFILAGICALVSLVVGLGLPTSSNWEKAVFVAFFSIVLAAVTQGLAALREKKLSRHIMELIEHIEDASPADQPEPRDDSPALIPGRGKGKS